MEDQALVQKVLNGDRTASSVLIDQHKRLVIHTVARLIDNDQDREELCQDVFVKVFEKLNSFNFDSKLSTWIVTIAYRMAINFLKKKKRNFYEEDLDKVSFEVGQIDSKYEDTDFAHFIHQLILQMPDTYRSVLTLFYLDGFSYPEIVDITGMPEGTIKNYLFRARKKLKELTEPYIGTEIHGFKN